MSFSSLNHFQILRSSAYIKQGEFNSQDMSLIYTTRNRGSPEALTEDLRGIVNYHAFRSCLRKYLTVETVNELLKLYLPLDLLFEEGPLNF